MTKDELKWALMGLAALLALVVAKPALLGHSISVSVTTHGSAKFGALIGGIFAGLLVLADKKYKLDKKTLLYAVGVFLAVLMFLG